MNNIIGKLIKIYKIGTRTLKTPLTGVVTSLKECMNDDATSSYFLVGDWGVSDIDIEKDEYIIL
jgi:hypothetical protein